MRTRGILPSVLASNAVAVVEIQGSRRAPGVKFLLSLWGDDFMLWETC